MSVLRIKAFRWMLAGAALSTVLCVVGAGTWLEHAFGRRGLDLEQPLPSALTAVATLEANRLIKAVDDLNHSVDERLRHALTLPRGAFSNTAVPWTPGLCDIPWPAVVVRAGLVDENTPVGLVDFPQGRCAERLGTLATQALTGPPFPADKDVARLAQATLWAKDRARENNTDVVSMHRDNTTAVMRLARRHGARVAWAEVALNMVPNPPATPGVRLDSLVLLDGVEVGYVHGGPQHAAVLGALQDVKGGRARALDLENVARTSSAQAVLAWLYPDHDDGSWAVSGVAVPMPSLGGSTSLLVVASVPWLLGWTTHLKIAVLSALAVALFMLLLLWLTARRLAKSLWLTAQEVREAWLGLRDDDVGSTEDARRAQTLLDTLAHRTRETLEAAFGKGERFWAPHPMERLLRLVRERLGINAPSAHQHPTDQK